MDKLPFKNMKSSTYPRNVERKAAIFTFPEVSVYVVQITVMSDYLVTHIDVNRSKGRNGCRRICSYNRNNNICS